VLVLGFDTSTPAVTVALGRVAARGVTGAVDADILAETTEVASNRHGELLGPLIEKVLRAGGVRPAALAAVAVGTGPGPFTGLRVGIVTAKAMADALGIPAYGQPSLTLLTRADAGVATNARRKQVYWAVLRDSTIVAGPEIDLPQIAAQRFVAAGVGAVCGEGPQLYPAEFAACATMPDCEYPRAALLVASVARRAWDGAPADDLQPLYLRRPDASPPGRPKAVTPR